MLLQPNGKCDDSLNEMYFRSKLKMSNVNSKQRMVQKLGADIR